MSASSSSSSSPRPLGIIGGSSYLNSTYIKEFTLITVNTKHGDVLVRTNTARSIYFIQRHAADPAHEYSPPHLINKKAIIACFQQLNVSHILAFGSVGSLKRTIPVGTLVVCDDYLNLHDQISFYDYGKQGHLVPTLSADLRSSILSALRSIGLNPLPNGTYTQTTGPRFETPAEIRLLAGYADIVGMTCAHEAALANELGIPYAVVCMVDNMANGLADKNLTEKEFHDGVKRNLATMETVLGCLLNHLQPGSVKFAPPKSVHDDDKRTLVDLIVNARYIVPVEPEGVYENASLVVHDGKIIALMSTSTAHTTYRASTIEDHPQAVLFPGFINAHTHTGMSLLRGYSDDLCLYDWLSKDIWPAEAQFVNPTFVRDSTELAIAEMLRGGTTTFNDMYFYPEIACDVIDTTGIRAVVGNIVLDFPSCYADKVETYLEKGATLRKTMGKHPRITFSWAPHAPYTVCDDNLTRIRDLAKQDSCQIHTHLHETPAEVADSMNGIATGTKHRSDEKTTPIINFDRLGLITPSLMAIHMTQMTDTEITLFATRKAHIVHCPSSNLKLASGFAPVTKLLAAGVNVALGTDSIASNNSLDMSTEMKTAALIAKCVSMDATVVPAWQALRMATINGAKALGLESSIGSLSVGKQADFVALQLDTIETMPLFDVVSHIVYAASRYQVSDVWVSGRHLLRNRQLLTLDEPSIKSRVLSWQTKLTEFRNKTHPNEQHSKKRRLDDGDVSMANGQ